MKQAADDFKEKAEETVLFLQDRCGEKPEIILVLGTGLGGIAEKIENALCLPYEMIPHFPRSTVTSHAGNMIFGILGNKRVAALQGRFHYYEGYSTRELTFPVRVLSLLGARLLLVSNASGGLNPAYAPGTLMIISDHLNFIPDNPLRGPNVDAWGPRFPDCSQVYDRDLIDLTIDCARKHNIANVVTGTYVAIPGPSLETPAETRFLRMCGADAVGMSTVPEVIVASHAGLQVLGISMVANVNDPDNFQPIRIEEILEQAGKAEGDFVQLVMAVLRGL
ncbi:MAG: purine-nucleoside phosphorylase [Proteobacteria bacterium]|nr:purine-nucleoside phosphorylase [Pseudomonadota bacterium]MBU4295384.1 purine-nucleoside phosphorylase [Pseudomonadota bacterium]MCG2749404.1 purine-nucleoside phosphorylase [Desulfobulbaceae bacterium]